ncbi:RecX family transcriptional regulator [uncultured Tyzzerella sp.]|uniref:regulatory protein RecX n=1 Tax=uncultured Tyzzerella sp. TaxID=2321398 RepID=UPI00294385A0|nr:RecX family transcriptional regulator [uncultured Tyzzerella sp.]
MIVTKIEKQKNNNKRYSVFIDNEFAFGIDEIDLLYYKIKENEPLDKDKYNYILNKLLLKRAKDKALKYLGYKMRSKKQVIKKLQEYEFPSNVINKVIKVLEKYNYINDEDFAKAFIKDKVNLKGYGTFKISYDLKMLGVDEEIFKKYLYDECFINESQKAKDLLLKKLKGKNIEDLDYKEKQKVYAYLARRGFSYDSINKAFNYLLEEF